MYILRFSVYNSPLRCASPLSLSCSSFKAHFDDTIMSLQFGTTLYGADQSRPPRPLELSGSLHQDQRQRARLLRRADLSTCIAATASRWRTPLPAYRLYFAVHSLSFAVADRHRRFRLKCRTYPLCVALPARNPRPDGFNLCPSASATPATEVLVPQGAVREGV
ncbi:hypothetical protein HGRIS_002027 [Hohenbuehelia grisea]|uniref:Uncharacterized protein n=1 Tax=Hohenbuehelia grisea TaxID=104357 RepID=A0ABR3JJN9_9AGAR